MWFARERSLRTKTLFIASDEGYLIVTGKGNKQRLVPIHKEAIKYLELYLEHERILTAPQANHSDTVFLSNRGLPLLVKVFS